MSRILVKDMWYDEITSTALYEVEFEHVVKQEAERLFPGYCFIRFKEVVESPEGSAKPDFALVDESYREWWVGEVELAHHNVDGHVIPQVRKLAQASYGEPEALALYAECPALEYPRILQMLKSGLPPRVFVVVNLPVPDWPGKFRAYDAIVAVVQIFRSVSGYVIRFNGESPMRNAMALTTCAVDKLIYQWLVIHSPAALPIKAKGRIILYYQGRASEWDRFDTGNKVYLQAARAHQLSRDELYEIVQQSDGNLAIRLSEQKAKR